MLSPFGALFQLVSQRSNGSAAKSVRFKFLTFPLSLYCQLPLNRIRFLLSLDFKPSLLPLDSICLS